MKYIRLLSTEGEKVLISIQYIMCIEDKGDERHITINIGEQDRDYIATNLSLDEIEHLISRA
jgi:hypothetical protein